MTPSLDLSAEESRFRSGNSRRKRKPDQTFKYVQPNENAEEKKEDVDQVKESAEKSKNDKTTKEDEDNDYEPPKKKEATDKEEKEVVSEAEAAAAAKKDPYEFLTDADRKLMQTDILEFLKRFAPKFYVPVYKTWTIPKSAVCTK